MGLSKFVAEAAPWVARPYVRSSRGAHVHTDAYLDLQVDLQVFGPRRLVYPAERSGLHRGSIRALKPLDLFVSFGRRLGHPAARIAVSYGQSRCAGGPADALLRLWLVHVDRGDDEAEKRRHAHGPSNHHVSVQKHEVNGVVELRKCLRPEDVNGGRPGSAAVLHTRLAVLIRDLILVLPKRHAQPLAAAAARATNLGVVTRTT